MPGLSIISGMNAQLMIHRYGIRPLTAKALMLCLSLMATLAYGADEKPVLTLPEDLPAGVENNLRVLIDLPRYPCRPGAGQKALIQRQVRDNGTQALQALGYYQSQVTQHWQAASEQTCFGMRLDVTHGTPTAIESFDVQIQGEASQDPAFKRLIDNARLAPGTRLRHDRYEKLKSALQQTLINNGYVEGDLTVHRLEVDRDRHTARIVMKVESGPRYRFGEVALKGDARIREWLLRAYLQFSAGEPFSNDRLLATQQAYLGSGYFSAVRLERGEPDPRQHTVPISITFTPRNEWALLAGVGVSTDTGPRLRLGVENRRINGAGHTARAETELSSVRQGVGASYQIPLSDPVNEKLDLHTTYQNEDTDSRESETLSVGADHIVKLESGWVATTSLEYLREIYNVADQVDQADLIMPGFQLSRVKSDDPVYPTRGWRLGGKVRGASQAISSTSFVQFDGWGKLILPVFRGRLLTRFEVGYTQIDSIRDLPASLRFFAGGDSSVRGFGYESLGPENDDGDVIGGRHLLIGSVEYDHPVSESWSVAVFSDAGNAFNDFNDYDMIRSAGFGVRWRSPLGPIRVDLARGLEADSDWRLHLSMGPDL
tara:strand:+ start:15585 stop:17387 length:1803 start_codon:yes stop_codon:yes gene_type:complete